MWKLYSFNERVKQAPDYCGNLIEKQIGKLQMLKKTVEAN